MRKSQLLLLTVALAAVGCATPERMLTEEVADPVVLEGHVQFVNVEGGCWGIRTDSATYEPVGGIPDDFLQDRLAVRATIRVVDGASICMIGPLVEIVTIESSTPSAGP